MRFVVNVSSDLLGECTPKLIRDSDEMRNSWMNHHYAHGSSGLVITCQEVKRIVQVFGHNFWI